MTHGDFEPKRSSDRPDAPRRRITDRPMAHQRAHALLHLLAPYLAIMLNVAMIALVLHVESEQRSQSARLRLDRAFIYQSCVRLNILRAEDNTSHLADYLVFKAVYESLRAQRRTGPVPAAILTGLQDKTWVPLTNCQHAVNTQGVRYRAPEPVFFTQRLPSPRDLKPPVGFEGGGGPGP